MQMVLLTALGVGGATIIGALIGFIFKAMSHKFSDIVLSFAAGVMLAAAVLGLVIAVVSIRFFEPLVIIATSMVGGRSAAVPPRIPSAR